MKIDKAINTLSAMLENYEGDEFPSEEVAIQLGIEALKHCRDIHHMSYEDLHILLPKETEP